LIAGFESHATAQTASRSHREHLLLRLCGR
jgi:hypothetical protein